MIASSEWNDRGADFTYVLKVDRFKSGPGVYRQVFRQIAGPLENRARGVEYFEVFFGDIKKVDVFIVRIAGQVLDDRLGDFRYPAVELAADDTLKHKIQARI